MRTLYLTLFIAACAPDFALAQTQIHTCTDADGAVVYSQLPCKNEAPAEPEREPDPDAAESSPPETEKVDWLPPGKAEEKPATSAERDACKKRYRNEIDAIDAEIRREYSREKDDDFKQRLLALTRRLRAC